MDASAIRKGIRAGFAWQGMTKIVVQVASWGSTLFVARLIEPADYGIVAAAAVFTELLVILTDMGLAHGLIQRPDITIQQLDGIFYLTLIIGLGAYGLLYLLAPVIADFYDMEILTGVIQLAGVGVILGSLKTVPLAIAMRRMDFRYRSLVEMVSTLVQSVTVVVLALLGYRVWSLVWGPIIGNLAMVCAYLPLLGRIPRFGFRRADVLEPVRFGLKVTWTNLLYYIWSRADTAIIGKVLGDRLLGMYSMAFQLAILPLDKIGAIFNHVLFPALSRLQHDLRASQEVFVQQHRNLLLISYPVLFGLAAVAEEAVAVLLTAKWLPIVPYLQGLCLVSALRVSGMMMPPVLYARGKPELVVNYSFWAIAILPAAFLIGVQFGLKGVVAGWALSYPVLYYVIARHCLRELRIGWFELFRPTLPVLLATALMVGAVLALKAALPHMPMLPKLAAAVVTGAVVYGVVIAFSYRTKLADAWGRFLVTRRGHTPEES